MGPRLSFFKTSSQIFYFYGWTIIKLFIFLSLNLKTFKCKMYSGRILSRSGSQSRVGSGMNHVPAPTRSHGVCQRPIKKIFMFFWTFHSIRFLLWLSGLYPISTLDLGCTTKILLSRSSRNTLVHVVGLPVVSSKLEKKKV